MSELDTQKALTVSARAQIDGEMRRRIDVETELAAAQARIAAVEAAARLRLEAGHNDTCETELSPDAGYPCSCGHDGLAAAVPTEGSRAMGCCAPVEPVPAEEVRHFQSHAHGTPQCGATWNDDATPLGDAVTCPACRKWLDESAERAMKWQVRRYSGLWIDVASQEEAERFVAVGAPEAVMRKVPVASTDAPRETG